MQCENPHRGIRRCAFSCLQSALQSAELASHDHQEWTAVFSEVLFPLIERLLQPEVYQTDPVGMGETRVAVAKLLCKVFLHYLVTLAEWEGMMETWFRILEQVNRLMQSGQGSGMVSLWLSSNTAFPSSCLSKYKRLPLIQIRRKKFLKASRTSSTS